MSTPQRTNPTSHKRRLLPTTIIRDGARIEPSPDSECLPRPDARPGSSAGRFFAGDRDDLGAERGPPVTL